MSAQSDLICAALLMIAEERSPAQIGGYSRVGQEQEQSQKVKLSLDAMRPDRRRVRLVWSEGYGYCE
jgi:hypothetical protein